MADVFRCPAVRKTACRNEILVFAVSIAKNVFLGCEVHVERVMENLIMPINNDTDRQARRYARFNDTSKERSLFGLIRSPYVSAMLLFFLAAPLYSLVAQDQITMSAARQADKAYLKSQLVHSKSTVKPAMRVQKNGVTRANGNVLAKSMGIRIPSNQDDIPLKKSVLRAHRLPKTVSSVQNPVFPEKQVGTAAAILWDDRLVNDDAASIAFHEGPSVAADGNGNYVVVWDDDRLGANYIFLQWFSASGFALGTNSAVNSDGGEAYHYMPSVAANTRGSSVVAWIDVRKGTNVYMQRFDASRLPAGPNMRVNDSSNVGVYSYRPVAVAMDYDGRIYVAWRDTRNGSTDIYFQRYSANGIPLGSNVKVNDDPGTASNTHHYAPVIAVDSIGNCVVAWHDFRNENYDIFLQRFDASGSAQGSNVQVNDDVSNAFQRYPSVGMDRYGNSTIAWSDPRNGNFDVYLQNYDEYGSAVGGNTMVNDDGGTTTQYFPTVSMNSDGFTVVAWMDDRNNNSDLYLQQYSSAGVAWEANVKVNDNAVGTVDLLPVVVIDNNYRYVLAWPDYRNGNDEIYAQRYDANDNPQGSNSKVNDDFGSGYQGAPSVGIDGSGTSTVVWEDYRSSAGVYLQRINSSGISLGSNIRVNDAAVGFAYYPAVAVNSSGSCVVAWQDSRNNSDYDIYLQRYGSGGSAQGANVRVTDTSSSMSLFNNEVSVAIDNSGNSIVAWADKRSGNNDIYLQRFNASGVAQGKNIRVNDDVGVSDQQKPSVAIDGSGNCIVAWMDDRNTNVDIYLQRYNSSGVAQGSNVRVNNDVGTADQVSPCVAIASAGNSVVAWEDYRNDATSGTSDIYIQRFDAGGIVQGTNIKVNDEIGTSGQYWPTVVFDGNGNCLIAWQDYRFGFNNPNVMGQGFTSSGTAILGNFRIVRDGPNQIEIVPKLAASGQTVVCAWQDNRRAKGFDIYSKSFSSDWGGLANPPAAPQNLSASAGNGEVTLSWNKNTEPNFLRYRIYRGLTSQGETLADSTSGGVTDTTRVITGLANGTTYFFRITAVDNAGLESGYSNEVGAVPSSGPQIFHTPPTDEVDVSYGVASTDVSVSATATDANGILTMYLQYQQVGQAFIATLNFTPPYDGSPSVQIPSTDFVNNAQGIGVAYRIVAINTLNDTAWTKWYSINVRNGSGTTIQPTFTFPVATDYPNNFTNAYRIFSIPFDLDDKRPSILLPNNFSDHLRDGMAYVNWRFQRINNGSYQDYEDFKDQPVLSPGNGFFLLLRDQKPLVLGGNRVTNADVMYTDGIQLGGGYPSGSGGAWYLLGDPLNMDIPWSSLDFGGVNVLDHLYYSGTGPISGWERTTTNANTLRRWEGLAVKTAGPCTVKFRILSPRPSIQGGEGTAPGTVAASMPKIEAGPDDWLITADAYRSDINMRCEGGGIGMRNGASLDHDQFDSYLPPMVGEKNVAIGFTGPNGPRLCDVRPLNANGGVWSMKVMTGDAGARVKLQFGGQTKLPNPTFKAFLIDLDQKTAYNLKEVSTLEISSGEGVRNFNIVVGTESYVQENSAGVELQPSSMKLYTNYPNPFNPETVIRYAIPNTAPAYRVTLKIFNMLGQEVAMLVNGTQSSGYYEVKFDGHHQSSGVYFSILTVTDGSKTYKESKKMMLLR